MHKRLFILGDSHIWGTEHTSPDGLACEWPGANKINKGYSDLPSETTFPYFLDDWKQVINLAWPGFGVDYVVERFIHDIFDKLEPDDNVVVFLPNGTRKMYAKELISNIFNQKRDKDYFDDKPLGDLIFNGGSLDKFNQSWPETFPEDVVREYEVNGGFTKSDDDAVNEFKSLDKTQRLKWLMDSALFMNLTYLSSASQIYNALNAILTIDKLAKAKGCYNTFFIIDSGAYDTDDRIITNNNIKNALGKDISDRILESNWSDNMIDYYFHKSKIKDIKDWMHEEDHFTAFAHKFFAEHIKNRFNKRRTDRE